MQQYQIVADWVTYGNILSTFMGFLSDKRSTFVPTLFYLHFSLKMNGFLERNCFQTGIHRPPRVCTQGPDPPRFPPMVIHVIATLVRDWGSVMSLYWSTSFQSTAFSFCGDVPWLLQSSPPFTNASMPVLKHSHLPPPTLHCYQGLPLFYWLFH